jgi:UTP-glucose-1-phosphate uridylyltransferase
MPAIVPVAGMKTEFGMEWDSSLVPVGPSYSAIEATVYECLHAGCTSIWIVANDDVAPLLRHT